jgi:hypothetical protein
MPTGAALSRSVYVDCVSVYGAVHKFYTPEVVVAEFFVKKFVGGGRLIT